MNELEPFFACFGEGELYEALTPQQISAWRGKLPDELLDVFAITGLRSFGDGFLWFCNPEYFAPVIDEWLPERPECTVFARSAFCDLWLWDGSQCWLLDVHYARLVAYRAPPLLIFNYIFTEEAILTDLLSFDSFKEVCGRVGHPAWDEMYAYVPAIVLGGSLDRTDTIERVKLREHLSFLCQAQDRIRIV